MTPAAFAFWNGDRTQRRGD